MLLQNLCRECGGSGICVHKHQKNKVSCARVSVFAPSAVRSWALALNFSRPPIPSHLAVPEVSETQHVWTQDLAQAVHRVQDFARRGPEALSLKVHEVLGVFEEVEALDSDHPAYARILEKVEGLRIMAQAYISAPLQTASAQQDKQKLLLQKKRKRDEMLPSYGMGMYAGLSPDMASPQQYQQMAANYYQQMHLMQQQMSRKASKMSKKAALEMNRNSADRYTPLILLLVARMVHCARE